jgi:fatty-acid desaturase
MKTVHDVKRITVIDDRANPVEGEVRVCWSKTSWFVLHALGAAVAVLFYTSFWNVAVFVVFSALTLCLGHSIGLHRLLIHQSFACGRALRYVLVHLGTLVGMGGPFQMMYMHDIRDWAQRHENCDAFLSHAKPLWHDALWQLFCEIRLQHPPRFTIEKEVMCDPVMQMMQRTWMWQQLPYAVVLYLIGGWGMMLWGISLRIVVSLVGHWLVNFFAHNQGERDWHLAGHALQGYNLPHLGILTMGEAWHNNHHAFPGSARFGLNAGQADPGWWALCVMKKLGLVWDLRRAEDLPERAELHPLTTN